MKQPLTKPMMFRFALAASATFTIVAASAGFAHSGPGAHNGPATATVQPGNFVALPCLICDEQRAGGRNDPGWGVSNHIGEGRAERDPDDRANKNRRSPARSAEG
jgi:hypothetical protein